MTVLALEYLVHSLDVANLVIVDDFSLDGTGKYYHEQFVTSISNVVPLHFHSKLSSKEGLFCNKQRETDGLD